MRISNKSQNGIATRVSMMISSHRTLNIKPKNCRLRSSEKYYNSKCRRRRTETRNGNRGMSRMMWMRSINTPISINLERMALLEEAIQSGTNKEILQLSTEHSQLLIHQD
jgi:hypothetical protein